MNLFISPFKNPFLNLALEDYFLRTQAQLPMAFFYVNRPCVVMGRFQNPWLECNLPYLAQEDIWLVRRQSGGGSVYHDEGNLNYSFIYPQGMIDRRRGVELIQRAFQRAEIPLEISARHDLWLHGKKLSGSAFKQIKDASFHHGTFLVNADLSKLSQCLRPTTDKLTTKAIPSVRSPVTKMTDHYPDFEVSDVIELIAHELGASAQELGPSLLSLAEVQQSYKTLTSWEWLWGETPQFELESGIIVHKGDVKHPTTGKFTAATMLGHLTEKQLTDFFPDFERQEISQKFIF